MVLLRGRHLLPIVKARTERDEESPARTKQVYRQVKTVAVCARRTALSSDVVVEMRHLRAFNNLTPRTTDAG